MQEQNFQNHSKYVIGYHVITSVLLLGALITAIIYTVKNRQRTDIAILTLLLTISALLGYFGTQEFLRYVHKIEPFEQKKIYATLY
jgi:uncharacterized membrane protein